MVKLFPDSDKHAENNQTNKYVHGYAVPNVLTTTYICLRKCLIQTVYLIKRFIDIIRLLKFKQRHIRDLLGHIAHTAMLHTYRVVYTLKNVNISRWYSLVHPMKTIVCGSIFKHL